MAGVQRPLEAKQAGGQAPLPSNWDSTARGPSMRYLEVSGPRVRYKGPGSDDRDAAAVRTDLPVPLHCPLYYFEVEIANKGRDGFIGIGFSVEEVKLDRLPGWEPHSYGYHGDDGHVFSGRGAGREYGPIFGTGDWVGVIYNRVERTISYTKKGIDLGIAFENVTEDALFPTVGFRTPDEEIVANFGTDLHSRPFRGDVETLRREAQQRLYSKILATSIPKMSSKILNSLNVSVGQMQEDIVGRLIFNYLTHHGYWDSAEAVARDVLGGGAEIPASAREESAALGAIGTALARGDADEAADVAERLAPGVLLANPRVSFALQCQKLCEMIRVGKDAEAMEYGRSVLAPAAVHSADRNLLEESLSLFAYQEVSTCPAAHLVGAEHRSELAVAVQRAVRTQLGRREVSALEDLYRQAKAVHEQLVREDVPAAGLVDVDDFIEHLPDG